MQKERERERERERKRERAETAVKKRLHDSVHTVNVIGQVTTLNDE